MCKYYQELKMFLIKNIYTGMPKMEQTNSYIQTFPVKTDSYQDQSCT